MAAGNQVPAAISIGKVECVLDRIGVSLGVTVRRVTEHPVVAESTSDHVRLTAADQIVTAATAADAIFARATKDHIDAPVARQSVGSGAAFDPIRPSVAVDRVAAGAGDDAIIAAAAADDVVTVTANDEIVERGLIHFRCVIGNGRRILGIDAAAGVAATIKSVG